MRRTWVWLALTILASGCFLRGRSKPVELGQTVTGEADAWTGTFKDYPASRHTFKGQKDARIVVDAKPKSVLIPSIALEHGGKVLAEVKPTKYQEFTRLEYELPEDGEYTLVVHFDDSIPGEYELSVKREKDTELSREGKFQLAHLDDQHAWLVDTSHLERKGDIASFIIFEVDAERGMLDGNALRSRRRTYEVNCFEHTYRPTSSAFRTVDKKGKQVVLPETGYDVPQAFIALGEKDRLVPLVCSKQTPQTLTWLNIEQAEDTFEDLLERQKAEKKPVTPLPPIDVADLPFGGTVHGTLPPRPEDAARPETWPYLAYTFKVPANTRFELDVKAAFHPYLRIRTKEKYLASSFDSMSRGVAGPIGGKLSFAEDTDLIAELTALESPTDGKFELSLEKFEEPKPRPNPKVKWVDLDRVYEGSVAGKAAIGRLKAKQDAAQKELDAEKAKLEAQRKELEKMKKVFEASQLADKDRALQEKIKAVNERLAELKRGLEAEKEKEQQVVVNRIWQILEDLGKAQDLDLILWDPDDLPDPKAVPDLTPDVIRAYDQLDKETKR